MNKTLVELYQIQMQNQMLLLSKGMYGEEERKETLPVDDVKLTSYHIQQLISEIGEVLDADKRWKNFRNEKYDRDGKREEIADCFIVLMNIAMFSGLTAEELENMIYKKMKVFRERIENNG